MIEFTEEEMDEAGEFELPSPGEHIGEVKEVREKSSRDGDNMWSILFKDATHPSNILTWDNLTFGPNSKGIAYKKLALLGVEKEGKSYKINHKDELVGKRVKLQIVHDEYKGKTQAKVDFHSENFGYAAMDAPGGGPDPDVPF